MKPANRVYSLSSSTPCHFSDRSTDLVFSLLSAWENPRPAPTRRARKGKNQLMSEDSWPKCRADSSEQLRVCCSRVLRLVIAIREYRTILVCTIKPKSANGDTRSMIHAYLQHPNCFFFLNSLQLGNKRPYFVSFAFCLDFQVST